MAEACKILSIREVLDRKSVFFVSKNTITKG